MNARMWIIASIAGWTFPTALAAATIAGATVPPAVYYAALVVALVATAVGVSGRVLDAVNRMNREAVGPVLEAFQHGHRLREEYCAANCTTREAQVIPLRRAVGSDWIGIDANATTVPLPRLPLGRRSRRPSPYRRAR